MYMYIYIYRYIYIYIYPMYIYIYIYIHISYTLNSWLRNLNTDFTLHNSLFGSVKLNKNADPDKCKYSGYETKAKKKFKNIKNVGVKSCI